MAAITQFVDAASPGDEPTVFALEFRSVLRRAADSEIFALDIDPELRREVRHAREYRPSSTRDVIIYHASSAPSILSSLLLRQERLVLVYHHTGSTELVREGDARVAGEPVAALEQLEMLRPRIALAMAASRHGADQLRRLGYEDVRRLPSYDVHRLRRVLPDVRTAKYIQVELDAPVLLSVGPITPGRRPDALVQAMHIAETYLGVRAYLLFVGDDRPDRYARAVRDQIRELDLHRVRLVGAASDARRRAFYDATVAVVSAGEAGGSNSALLEAMAAGRPLIARSSSGTSESLGSSALLLAGDDGADVLAEAIAEVLADASLRAELSARGLRTAAQLDPTRMGRELVSALLEVT